MRDLCFTSATELLRLYRARKASPLEAMQSILAQVDRVNPRVNAVVTLAGESALADARGDAGDLAADGAPTIVRGAGHDQGSNGH